MFISPTKFLAPISIKPTCLLLLQGTLNLLPVFADLPTHSSYAQNHTLSGLLSLSTTLLYG